MDAYLGALRQTREVTSDDTKKIRQSIQRLQGMVNYPFRALELLASVNEEQVSQVFVRINSKGQRLNEADFILTLMSVYWDAGVELERFSRAAKKRARSNALQPFPPTIARIRCFVQRSATDSSAAGCNMFTRCCAERIWRRASSVRSGAWRSSTGSRRRRPPR